MSQIVSGWPRPFLSTTSTAHELASGPSSLSTLMLFMTAMLPLLELWSRRQRLAMNFPATGNWRKHATVVRQCLVRADHQTTAGVQRPRNAVKRLALSFDVEIGKDKIAAQDEVKEARRNFRPDVLKKEGESFTIFGANAIAIAIPRKRYLTPASGNVFEATRREAPLPRAAKNGWIGVAANDLEPPSRQSWAHIKLPKELERVNLFAASAACTPTTDRAVLQTGCLA